MPDFNPHITVATVIKKDNLFLMVEEYSGGKRVINQPAGHVEAGETLIEAAQRETLEETGWLCEVSDFMTLSRWIHPDTKETYFRVTFAAIPLVHNHEQALDPAIIQTLWLSYEEICSRQESHRSPAIMQDIENFQAAKFYPLTILQELDSIVHGQ